MILFITIVAFYFSVMVPPQEWPVVIGPYETWEECASVREFLDRKGYETDSCGTMPYPQEGSQLLKVIEIPKKDA